MPFGWLLPLPRMMGLHTSAFKASFELLSKSTEDLTQEYTYIV